MDALSLTRERVRVWVCGPLPDTRTHWRRRRILISGDFSRPACTLSPTLSRNLTGEEPDAGMRSRALAVGVYRQSLIVREGIQARRRGQLPAGLLSSAAVTRSESASNASVRA